MALTEVIEKALQPRDTAQRTALLAAALGAHFTQSTVVACWLDGPGGVAATAIDDVLNYAKTTVREIEVLDVPTDRWMAEMAEHLRIGGAALGAGFALLRDDPQAAHAKALEVHKSERNAEKVYRAAVADVFAGAQFAPAIGPGGAGVAEAFDRLLLNLRRREVYRHLSNAADRLDVAGRALLDIIFADV